MQPVTLVNHSNNIGRLKMIDDKNVIDSDSEEESAADVFAEIQKRNREKEERLKKERAEANRKVKRSYRLNKD